MTSRPINDNAQFLAAAEEAAACLMDRVYMDGHFYISQDELEEIAYAFDRAVRLAIEAHISRARKGAA